MLTGVPIAHGPDDHVPFYIATPMYQESYLNDTDIRPMGNGFLDGLSAELVTRGIDESLPTGVFTTPTHPQAPDAAAAIRLLTALKRATRSRLTLVHWRTSLRTSRPTIGNVVRIAADSDQVADAEVHEKC